MKRKQHNNFVADGYGRACAGSIVRIRTEVEREYAERLRSAGWLERLLLYRQMHREIKKRLEHVAPPWGLYFSS